MPIIGRGLGAIAGLVSLIASAPLMAQAAGEPSAVIDPACDRACLIGIERQYMAALAARDPSALPVARDLEFSENDVVLPLGKGLWATVTGVDAKGLEAADPITGNVAWFGAVQENGKPAFYAMRMHVEDGLIDEVETVVQRKGALPAPFGDAQNMQHFPEFDQVLPVGEQRSRERLLRIADSYFNTVELNDGTVFAPFAEDCSRLENGITTTAPRPGEQTSSAAIASGCEAQFKLGIYRINKRIRRHLYLVDVERGVVVGTGFFDHANEFDRYNLTDGREMKTALKWPNSISLVEAFRIRNGQIQRIEATFTYVPYFMRNPFWEPKPQPPRTAPAPAACDEDCLTGNARALMHGMVGNKWQGLPWADAVGYAENSVGIRVGEGIWATVTAADDKPLVIADPETGKAVWIGQIEEHGQPSIAAIAMSADGKKIGAVDALIRRKEYGAPFADPISAPEFALVPARRRTSRAAMSAAATQFYEALNAHGGAPAIFADGCHWFVNGADVGDCMSPFGSPALAGIERVRDRKLLAADEGRGLIAFQTFEDLPGTPGPGGQPAGTYPHTSQVVELFRFEGGKVTQVHAYTSELPYGMRPH